jgi:hypothetical protein
MADASRIHELEEKERLLLKWVDALNGKDLDEVETLCVELREMAHSLHDDLDPSCPICNQEHIAELISENERLRLHAEAMTKVVESYNDVLGKAPDGYCETCTQLWVSRAEEALQYIREEILGESGDRS